MSQLKTTSLSHKDNNTGTPNITMYPDGTTSLPGTVMGGFRNQLINGNFSTWQRGDDITVSGAAYTADRWLASQSGVRMQAATPSASLPDFGWCAVFTAAQTADYIEQPVELVRNGRMEPFLPGTTWTFSFYHDKSLADFTFGCGFVDTSASLASGDVVVPDTTAFESLGNSRYSYTFTIPVNQTIASTRKAFVARIASSRSSVITNARLTGCQLEPGPVATPFELRPIGTELALCQRYYYKAPDGIWRLYLSGNGTVQGNMWFPVTMRTTPTCQLFNVSASGEVTSVDAVNATPDGFLALCQPNNSTLSLNVQAAAGTYSGDAEL